MTAKYFAILTNQGAARLANATALGKKLNLTQLAVGDANGVLPMPNPAQTALIHEQRRAPLNLIEVDPQNLGQIIVEQIIPEDEGGFWIREIGLYDDEGLLVAVANCPETYKPKLQEGSGRTQTIRMVLIVSSTEAVTLKIDPSVVLATRKYVDDKVIEVKAYADSLLKKHVDAANPHTQYPLIANALKEMADAGLVSEVLKNLGLGELASVGVNYGHTGTNGYIRLPMLVNGTINNVILQWGAGSPVDGKSIVTFPLAFSEKPYYVGFTNRQSQYPSVMQSQVIDDSTINNTGFVTRQMFLTSGGSTINNGTSAFYWFALGRV
ncbi:phage tail protein [Siccibacter turicensis]